MSPSVVGGSAAGSAGGSASAAGMSPIWDEVTGSEADLIDTSEASPLASVISLADSCAPSVPESSAVAEPSGGRFSSAGAAACMPETVSGTRLPGLEQSEKVNVSLRPGAVSLARGGVQIQFCSPLISAKILALPDPLQIKYYCSPRIRGRGEKFEFSGAGSRQQGQKAGQMCVVCNECLACRHSHHGLKISLCT